MVETLNGMKMKTFLLLFLLPLICFGQIIQDGKMYYLENDTLKEIKAVYIEKMPSYTIYTYLTPWGPNEYGQAFAYIGNESYLDHPQAAMTFKYIDKSGNQPKRMVNTDAPAYWAALLVDELSWKPGMWFSWNNGEIPDAQLMGGNEEAIYNEVTAVISYLLKNPVGEIWYYDDIIYKYPR